MSKVTGRVARALVALVTLLGLSGCPKKASWLPNDRGGYTLVTQAESMDQAVTRFRRTATDLCGAARYALSEPVITHRGWRFGPGAWGMEGGTTITVQCDCRCQ
jgi:hypothetical protein